LPLRPKRPFDFQHHLHNQSSRRLIPFIEALTKIVRSFGPDRFHGGGSGRRAGWQKKCGCSPPASARFCTSYALISFRLTSLRPATCAGYRGKLERARRLAELGLLQITMPQGGQPLGGIEAQDDWAKLFLALLMGCAGKVFPGYSGCGELA
jgi:hypothetical protein